MGFTIYYNFVTLFQFLQKGIRPRRYVPTFRLPLSKVKLCSVLYPTSQIVTQRQFIWTTLRRLQWTHGSEPERIRIFNLTDFTWSTMEGSLKFKHALSDDEEDEEGKRQSLIELDLADVGPLNVLRSKM